MKQKVSTALDEKVITALKVIAAKEKRRYRMSLKKP